jgi:transcriptional regulator GlxA family with amidase domain
VNLAFVLYDDFAVLDLAGPTEVLARWPGARLDFVARSREPVRADSGIAALPTATFDDAPAPDVVVVPGSARPLGPLGDEALLGWVRAVAPTATWLASVCTGAGIYAAAGLLAGRRVTTHWAFREGLASMGADIEVAGGRVVFDPPFVSSAGVSAGIDMALALTARVHGDEAGRVAQLALEYDPQPPFDAGTPEKAGPEVTRAAFRQLAEAAAPPAA